ncbi:MAG: class I SAM-dependent methyltransferase [Acidobacteria bacterium]|nr:class I SAM-dependent methyltransferase [Acidobacteriota bacterium]
MSQIEDYERIADAYEESMRLPFRDAVEQHTLMGILGDVTGMNAVDMACGDGFYARLLKRAGASAVLGIDVSAEMVRRAEEEERRRPLGCTYRRAEVAGLRLAEPVEVVVGMYLLGYAQTGEELRGFCQACHDALRPSGRFVGVNDDVRNPGSGEWRQYGLERQCPTPPAEGDGIRYRITNADGRQFELQNFYLSPETYRNAFREAGFSDFRWVDVSLQPSERGNPFWDDFLNRSPIVGFEATR